jgi:hypothetical protein
MARFRSIAFALIGLVSLLASYAYLLGGWWYGKLRRLRSRRRLCRGLVVILPGIEGKSSLTFNIALGLVEGGVECAIEIHDWTTGIWPLCLLHLWHTPRARRQAEIIAARIIDYQDRHPGRPTFLIGHSGGGGVAALVLECLPPQRHITAAILLAPALARHYDLSQALRHTERGLWNFHSPLDLFFLTAGTFLLGNLTGDFDVSAGAWGFSPPTRLSATDQRLYRSRLHQCRYRLAMAAHWHLGGHFGWANCAFVAEWLAEIVVGRSAQGCLIAPSSRSTLNRRIDLPCAVGKSTTTD